MFYARLYKSGVMTEVSRAVSRVDVELVSYISETVPIFITSTPGHGDRGWLWSAGCQRHIAREDFVLSLRKALNYVCSLNYFNIW
jgi:hypothetical protein